MFAVMRSTVALKVFMALSGLMMVGFLVGHMAGNLLVFGGSKMINDYAAGLHSMPAVLWLVRMGLLAALVVHVGSAIALIRRNRKARGEAYGKKKSLAYSLASRQMALTGTLVLCYIFYHLAHFTWKWTHPEFVGRGDDVYAMIVASFQSPWVSALYLGSMVVLGVHLFHGISSTLDTLGLHSSSYIALLRGLAIALAVALAVGFSSIPLAVLLGWIS